MFQTKFKVLHLKLSIKEGDIINDFFTLLSGFLRTPDVLPLIWVDRKTKEVVERQLDKTLLMSSLHMFLSGLLQPEVVVPQSQTAGMAAPLSSSPITSNMPCTHPSSHSKTVDFLDDNGPASISLPSPFLTIKTTTWSNFFQTSAP